MLESDEDMPVEGCEQYCYMPDPEFDKEQSTLADEMENPHEIHGITFDK